MGVEQLPRRRCVSYCTVWLPSAGVELSPLLVPFLLKLVTQCFAKNAPVFLQKSAPMKNWQQHFVVAHWLVNSATPKSSSLFGYWRKIVLVQVLWHGGALWPASKVSEPGATAVTKYATLYIHVYQLLVRLLKRSQCPLTDTYCQIPNPRNLCDFFVCLWFGACSERYFPVFPFKRPDFFTCWDAPVIQCNPMYAFKSDWFQILSLQSLKSPNSPQSSLYKWA